MIRQLEVMVAIEEGRIYARTYLIISWCYGFTLVQGRRDEPLLVRITSKVAIKPYPGGGFATHNV